jgi:hypothetical protein
MRPRRGTRRTDGEPSPWRGRCTTLGRGPGSLPGPTAGELGHGEARRRTPYARHGDGRGPRRSPGRLVEDGELGHSGGVHTADTNLGFLPVGSTLPNISGGGASVPKISPTYMVRDRFGALRWRCSKELILITSLADQHTNCVAHLDYVKGSRANRKTECIYVGA